jgi:hypothetical protein
VSLAKATTAATPTTVTVAATATVTGTLTHVDVAPSLAPITAPAIGMLSKVVSEGLSVTPAVLGAPATLGTAAAAAPTSSTLVLDPTIHLPDGTVVTATDVTVAVPPPSTLRQRVIAEVTAR